MRCSKCNREMNETGKCSYCDSVGDDPVRVMSQEEQATYHGVTIDDKVNEQAEQPYMHVHNPYQKVYVKNVNMGHSTWLTKLVIALVVMAIAAFVLFVALPVALIGIGIGIVVWLILTFIRGYM